MKKSITLIFLLTISSIFAQKMKILDGSTDNIRHINKYDVLFVYDELSIPNYDSEEAFLNDKMAKREEDHKGDGERFRESWYADRENIFHLKFFKVFKKVSDDEITLSEHSNAKYVMNIHTQSIYSGYNVGVWGQQAKIDVKISFFSKTEPNNKLLVVSYEDVEGLNDYNTGERIGNSYVKLAKILAKKMKKLYKYDATFVNELKEGESSKMDVSLTESNISEKIESPQKEKEEVKKEEKFDVIYTKDGNETKAKVVEITAEFVKYKKQSQLDGPLRNVPVKDVFLIIYKDGTRENFKSKE